MNSEVSKLPVIGHCQIWFEHNLQSNCQYLLKYPPARTLLIKYYEAKKREQYRKKDTFTFTELFMIHFERKLYKLLNNFVVDNYDEDYGDLHVCRVEEKAQPEEDEEDVTNLSSSHPSARKFYSVAEVGEPGPSASVSNPFDLSLDHLSILKSDFKTFLEKVLRECSLVNNEEYMIKYIQYWNRAKKYITSNDRTGDTKTYDKKYLLKIRDYPSLYAEYLEDETQRRQKKPQASNMSSDTDSSG